MVFFSQGLCRMIQSLDSKAQLVLHYDTDIYWGIDRVMIQSLESQASVVLQCNIQALIVQWHIVRNCGMSGNSLLYTGIDRMMIWLLSTEAWSVLSALSLREYIVFCPTFSVFCSVQHHVFCSTFLSGLMNACWCTLFFASNCRIRMSGCSNDCEWFNSFTILWSMSCIMQTDMVGCLSRDTYFQKDDIWKYTPNWSERLCRNQRIVVVCGWFS